VYALKRCRGSPGGVSPGWRYRSSQKHWVRLRR
jgi:hypothetical protein